MRLSPTILLQLIDPGHFVLLDERTGDEVELTADVAARLEIGLSWFRRNDADLARQHAIALGQTGVPWSPVPAQSSGAAP